MLRLHKLHLFNIHKAESLHELQTSFQLAIELEHSTIPPYLTAMYSLKPGSNHEIRGILKSIVAEEMLHMAIAANILNAIGGSPEINKPDFIPQYPGDLPLGIGDHLNVGLEKFSKDLVRNKFMMIEEPGKPVDLLNGPEALEEHEHTIGAFYLSLQNKLKQMRRHHLPGKPTKQVTDGFKADELFAIKTVDDAIRAMDVIIEQGEGTSLSPIDFEGELAHFYKFEEIWYGRKIVQDETSLCGYGFTGDPIEFDEEGVYPVFPNTKISMTETDSTEYFLLRSFNGLYSQLLQELHITFNGQPSNIDKTYKLMGDLAKSAEKVCAVEFPGKPGYNLGLPFEYDDHLI